MANRTGTKPRRNLGHVKAAITAWGDVATPSVDREQRKIYGAVSMLSGVEALGWNMFTDSITLALAAQLSNKHRGGLGVQMRFGHPGASENTAGKKFAVCKNFRVEGGALRHDIEFFTAEALNPVFTSDPGEWAMAMADHHPAEISESYVMDVDLVWTFEDGSEEEYMGDFPPGMFEPVEPPEGALTPYPVMRPVEVVYLDMVNEGALTHNGLFESAAAHAFFEGSSSEFTETLFEGLDEFRARYGVELDELPKKAQTLIGQYMQSRGKTNMGNRTIGGKKPTTKKPVGAQRGAGNRTHARFEQGDQPPEEELLVGDTTLQEGGDGEAELEEGDGEDVDLDALEADTAEAAVIATEGSAEADEQANEAAEATLQAFEALNLEHGQIKRILANMHTRQNAFEERLLAMEGEPTFTTQLGPARPGGSNGLRQRPAAPVAASRQRQPTASLQRQPPGSVNGRNAVAASASGAPMESDEWDDDPAKATLEAAVRRSGAFNQGVHTA